MRSDGPLAFFVPLLEIGWRENPLALAFEGLMPSSPTRSESRLFFVAHDTHGLNYDGAIWSHGLFSFDQPVF